MRMRVRNWLSRDIPTGWGVLVLRCVVVAVVAFLVLQAKEWFDARTSHRSRIVAAERDPDAGKAPDRQKI
jgi:ABC-type uncharacterized transport system permease subunit